ncbi:TPA: transposase, partial [Streptococcus suis]
MAFALNIAKQLTDEANQGKKTIISQFDETSLIPLNNPLTVSTGHLFIDKIFYELKLDKLCRQITKDSKITFNLTEVLKTLISSRILSPGSKLNAHQFSQQYLFAPDLELQHFYRGLDLLADHFEAIQTHAYKKSATIVPRDTSILYYDCSNFYFEIEEEDDLRRYGKSKEHRPNPIVQMGLFLDGDGLPLAFDLFPGNRNEMPTLKPLETKVI